MINDTQVIKEAFITFSIVTTIWVCMLPSMILSKIGDYGDKHFKKPLKKMVYECITCMIPYYGTPLYWVLFGKSWVEWVVVILVAMGMATIFVKMKRN